jgi:hypothetical protein
MNNTFRAQVVTPAEWEAARHHRIGGSCTP